MKTYGIITGDIKNFTKLESAKREELASEAKTLFRTMVERDQDAVLFRGDSYQLQIDDIQQILKKSVQLICWFKLKSDKIKRIKISTKISIGIGPIDYEGETVLESDGEAFHLSGRGFDDLGKDELIRLTVNDKTRNKLFKLILMYINGIAKDWTTSQAKTIYHTLEMENSTQDEVAKHLNMSQPNIAKSLGAAKWKEAEAGIKYINEELESLYRK